MPLEIIRNDLTRVSADAIVNTANPEVAVGRGTDYAVYKAAGFERLLEARGKIGPIEPGSAAVTPAFDLDAKYIIHTVGPEWRGGDHGEKETVASCYRSCLDEAERLGCESIAFPLISTGTYGFPKDAALDIAIREITGFLDTHEMDVRLVVYDKESFALSSELFDDVRSYIDDAEQLRIDSYNAAPFLADASSRLEGARVNGRRGRGVLRRLIRREPEEDHSLDSGELNYSLRTEAPAEPYPELYKSAGPALEEEEVTEAERLSPDTGALYSKPEIEASLEDLLKSRDESFQQKLFKMIDSRGLTDPEVYKKANIDRKLFSKIRSNTDYRPTKKTAVAFAFALGLNLDETTDLLRSAGMTLSPSSDFDIIIRYCIERGITNIHEVNCILFEFDQMLLGA